MYDPWNYSLGLHRFMFYNAAKILEEGYRLTVHTVERRQDCAYGPGAAPQTAPEPATLNFHYGRRCHDVDVEHI
ncbi:MAG: hypothetical protein ACPGO3_10480 [Magnetospiraceae bacterium]